MAELATCSGLRRKGRFGKKLPNGLKLAGTLTTPGGSHLRGAKSPADHSWPAA